MPFTLRLWDLGGQNDFINTHHLFLDAKATTLIVLDITKKLHRTFHGEIKLGNPKTPAEVLCYWLNSLQEKNDSTIEKPNVVIVLTHIDLIRSTKRDKYIASYIEDILKLLNGKPYSELITQGDIYTVDNNSTDDSIFQNLKKQLLQKLIQQEGWGKKIPIKWLKLEADILERKENETKFISLSQVAEMGTVNGMISEEIESFLRTHNSLGNFIHYTDPDLRHIIITDPQWLVDMCKSVITNHIFLEERNLSPLTLDQLKKGHVTKNALAELWGGEEVTFLTELMLKFHLFLPLVESGEYLIPCMLPSYDLNNAEPFKDMVCLYGASQRAQFVGTFHKFLSLLTCNTNWSVSRKDPLSYSEASLNIGPGLVLRLSLQKESVIETNICCTRSVMKKDLTSIIVETKERLFRCMLYMNIANSNDVLVLCPYSDPNDKGQCTVKGEEGEDFHVNLVPQRCRFHGHDLVRSAYIWSYGKYTLTFHFL